MEHKRTNGGKNIDYLVGDHTLDFNLLDGKEIVIVGERHFHSGDRALQAKLIEYFKPDFVLCEGLGDYELVDYKTKYRYFRKPLSEHYYEVMTKDLIELSLDYKIPFIGIEYVDWKEGEYEALTLAETFKVREDHWMKTIEKYSVGLGGKRSKLLVIVGDTHLRTIKTTQLGPVSPLYTKYNNKPNSVVVRSPIGEIE